MEVHDMRGAELGYIQQVVNRFPPQTHRQGAHTYTHRRTTDNDIDNAIDRARIDNAEMVLIQEYGIAWFIPSVSSKE